MKRSDQIRDFVQILWEWFCVHKRELPWRDLKDKNDTERAYKILVSEVMLQQTQVPRVIIIFKRFLDEFPTINHLANASNREVILAWRGMGYNSRALRLRDAAKIISEEFNGEFPKELEELLSIKGIGHYTAAAIRNFAFNLPTPGIDTNIRRVLHRTFFGPEKDDGTFETSDRELTMLCEEILTQWVSQRHSARDFFAAMMDYGSLVQTKKNPKWDICWLTEKKLMKTTRKSFERRAMSYENSKLTTQSSKRPEPGRIMAGRYIPNRIFRGKIVEALRDNHKGLTFDQLGKEICIDWGKEHQLWLKKLITKLIQDRLLQEKNKRFELAA